MKAKVINSALAAMITLLVVADLAFGKAKEITISDPAKLASGPELKPGSYKVDLVKTEEAAEVVFYRGDELVAKSAAKLVEEPRKAAYTQIVYDTQETPKVIKEMVLRGSKERIIFERPTEMPKGGQ